MKKISVLMLMMGSSLIFGQKVSDYKYVLIPEKFETFKSNSYGLEAHLTNALKAKNYVVLPSGIDQWPSEARDNSCNIVNAEVLNDKSLFTNKVILQFKDCHKKVILESKGRSDIKDFEEGLGNALKQALLKVAPSNPVNILPASTTTTTAPTTAPTTAATNTAQSTHSAVSTATPVSTSANYSDGKTDLQKIQIDSNQFILAKSGSSVPFAIFKSTSKKEVFLVKLADGNTTIGYYENGNIVIDRPQADGRYTKEVFNGK
ncbi:hypothetical protein [Chryseobacterium pennipullorum]|uniref:Uncharacterized protein n=1 Tax=Chryseobacterium pennipullorum TaxID=2258963 RepID=A0A3D9B5X8_9FLAO|nr:hypothetical protein [Chryseobacterium pennipullorum]REC48656.1 hypothetical protein DRF67_07425 [Chryseobacterium pennipullorum]